MFTAVSDEHLLTRNQEKLNEAIIVLNKSLQVSQNAARRYRRLMSVVQEINIQNMNVELVAQMFKNYSSNVVFHLEGETMLNAFIKDSTDILLATDSLKEPS